MLAVDPHSSVTIKYEHKVKKTTKGKTAAMVKVKVVSSAQGKVIKYRTRKAKEFSKIMTHLGPYGVNGEVGAGSLMANRVYKA